MEAERLDPKNRDFNIVPELLMCELPVDDECIVVGVSSFDHVTELLRLSIARPGLTSTSTRHLLNSIVEHLRSLEYIHTLASI